jgi:preprotein translocase subunit SecG
VIYLLYTVHVLISIFLILVVLLQRGKGADLSVFGGGATQAAFGARGQASVLHKLTVACFVLFILTTLTIGLLEAGRQPSAMRDVPGASEESSSSAPPAAPGATPGAEGGASLEAGEGAEGQDAGEPEPEPAAEEPPAAASESDDDGEGDAGSDG